MSVRGLAGLAPGKPVEVVIHKPDGTDGHDPGPSHHDRRADRLVQGGLRALNAPRNNSSGRREAPHERHASVKIPAGEKITITHGKLQVPDHPIVAVHRGRRHRARHLARVGARARRRRRAGVRRQAQDRLGRGVRGREGAGRLRRGLPAEPPADGDPRRHPRVPGRDQGPAHHAGGRGLPLAERDAPPGARPLRVPPPGEVLQGRAVAGQAPGGGRHGDLPREHGGHLRRHRVAHGDARGQEGRRLPAREMGVDKIRFPNTSSIGIKPISKEGSERLIRAAMRYAIENEPAERDPRPQGQHPEVHRGHVHEVGLRPGQARVLGPHRVLGGVRREAAGRQDPDQGCDHRRVPPADPHPARRVRRDRRART